MDTNNYYLSVGGHNLAEPGEPQMRCAMEWVSHLCGEPHTDIPRKVDSAVRSIMMMLNDKLADKPRQKLRPYLTRTIGTAGDGRQSARGHMLEAWVNRHAWRERRHPGTWGTFDAIGLYIGRRGFDAAICELLEALLPLESVTMPAPRQTMYRDAGSLPEWPGAAGGTFVSANTSFDALADLKLIGQSAAIKYTTKEGVPA